MTGSAHCTLAPIGASDSEETRCGDIKPVREAVSSESDAKESELSCLGKPSNESCGTLLQPRRILGSLGGRTRCRVWEIARLEADAL